jgi:hypothetical protein
MGGVPGFARILLAVENTCRGSALYDIPFPPNTEAPGSLRKTKHAYLCEEQTRQK